MEGTDKSGCEDVPLLTAELHRRLNAIIYHQCKELMDRVRAKVWKLAKGERRKKKLIYKILNSSKNHPQCYALYQPTKTSWACCSKWVPIRSTFSCFSPQCSQFKFYFKLFESQRLPLERITGNTTDLLTKNISRMKIVRSNKKANNYLKRLGKLGGGKWFAFRFQKLRKVKKKNFFFKYMEILILKELQYTGRSS